MVDTIAYESNGYIYKIYPKTSNIETGIIEGEIDILQNNNVLYSRHFFYNILGNDRYIFLTLSTYVELAINKETQYLKHIRIDNKNIRKQLKEFFNINCLKDIKKEYDNKHDEKLLLKADSLQKLKNLREKFDENFDYFFDDEKLRKKYNAKNNDSEYTSNSEIELLLDIPDLKRLIKFYQDKIDEIDDRINEIKRENNINEYKKPIYPYTHISINIYPCDYYKIKKKINEKYETSETPGCVLQVIIENKEEEKEKALLWLNELGFFKQKGIINLIYKELKF